MCLAENKILVFCCVAKLCDRTFTIGSVLVIADNAADFYFADSPF